MIAEYVVTHARLSMSILVTEYTLTGSHKPYNFVQLKNMSIPCHLYVSYNPQVHVQALV
jgi:hypothetical protein